MILQALSRYYDILLQDPESDIAPPGYSTVEVAFAIEISTKGKFENLIPLVDQVPMGRKIIDKPKRMIVPEQGKHSNKVSAFFLCDNSTYVLGISDEEGDYGIKRFQAFRDLNKELLSKVDSSAARAVIAFLDTYDPRKAKEYPEINSNWEALLKGARLVFFLNGEFVHKDSLILNAWEKHKAGSEAVLGQCLVSGEFAPVARLHPVLKGVGTRPNPLGASLVSFNNRAYESYNKTELQGLNSPVSEKATFAYGTTLNYLLSRANENRKFNIGDTTVVYWAETDKKGYAKAFLGLCEPEIVEIEPPADEEAKPARDKKSEKKLKKVADKVKRVQALDVNKLLEGLEDENPRFYILGLAPNAARVSVRFFHSDPFNKIVEKIMRHYKDLEIVKEFDNQHTWLTIQDVLKETISKKASDPEASPLMAGSMFRAILDNTHYPAALYNAIINRIRADQDDEKKFIRKVNYERAAIIKAYLLRKYRNQPQHPIQEVLVMSLNEQSTVPAYLLGRLFAVLEKVQQEAIGDMNASIKDRYFTSACASPRTVFPTLLRLSQHWISKAEYGYASDRRIQDILNLLDIEKNPIPARLTLDEQGVFVLGYYHQRAAFFVKNNNSAETTTETN